MSSVDVVIPCYNYARYLRACAESVLAQVGVEVRVLIIDDHSSDDTPAVGRALEAEDGRVEFRRHEQNCGHIATYNEGVIDWSEGDFVVLLSADDMLVRGSLRRAVRIMEADPSVGMVYGRALHFDEDAELPRAGQRERKHSRWLGPEWIAAICKAGHNVISSPEVVVRGAVQRSIGGYRSELPHTADLEMWLRIAAVSDIAYVRGVAQALYRVHQASMLRTRYGRKLTDLQHRRAAFDAFFDSCGAKVADSARLHALASRALAREALWEACRAYDRNELQETCAEELVEFALLIHPGATTEPEYRALKRRRQLGPRLCRLTQAFALPALGHRLKHWVQRQHWKREGV